MVNIISRSEWGAKPWRTGTTTRPLSRLGWFLVHYNGGPPPASVGNWVPRNIEAIHLGNGWSGVGYHFVVDQAGNIYEGRGWGLVGAHSPPHNADGLGVYVAIGGDQEPTEAAKASVRWLYDEANRRTGKTLRKSWHGYDYATACPGPHLIAWVKGGMKVDGKPAADTGAQSIKPKPRPRPKKVTYYQPSGVSMTVKQIQKAAGVKADGYYGKSTRAAVKSLQSKLGVAADSLWGPDTEKAYLAYIGKTSTPKPKPSTPKAPKFPLPSGHWYGVQSSNPKNHSGYYAKDRAGIKQWQKQMKRRGWSIGVDGIFGVESKSVARSFQREKGLSVDGLVGISTWRAAWSEPIT